MSLSTREQQLLAEIEAQTTCSDPRLASHLTNFRQSRWRQLPQWHLTGRFAVFVMATVIGAASLLATTGVLSGLASVTGAAAGWLAVIGCLCAVVALFLVLEVATRVRARQKAARDHTVR